MCIWHLLFALIPLFWSIIERITALRVHFAAHVLAMPMFLRFFRSLNKESAVNPLPLRRKLKVSIRASRRGESRSIGRYLSRNIKHKGRPIGSPCYVLFIPSAIVVLIGGIFSHYRLNVPKETFMLLKKAMILLISFMMFSRSMDSLV